MKRGYTVYAVASDNRQIGHPHLTVIDDRHIADLVGVVRIPLLNLAEEAAVDLFRDLINPGKQAREKIDGPFLQRFRHNRVVRIGAGPRRKIPRLIPAVAVLIHQQAHQFRNRHGRMRVIELESHFVRKVVQRAVHAEMLLKRLLHGSGDEEVLLLQPELLAGHMVVVRVEHLCDGAGEIVLLHRLLVLAPVKGSQLKAVDRFRVPDPKRVDDAVLVADDRNIVRDGTDRGIILVDETVAAGRGIILDAGVAAEADLLRMLRALQLERVAVLQPVVRHFLLIAVLDLLSEHPVVVADAAAVGVVAAGGQRIHEAGGQPAESTVAQRRVRLLILDRVDIEAQLVQRFLHILVFPEVEQIVAQCPADQEFHRKVVDDLVLLLPEPLAGIHPLVDDRILDDVRHCLKDLLLTRVLQIRTVKLPDVGLHVLDKPLLVESLQLLRRAQMLCLLYFVSPDFRKTAAPPKRRSRRSAHCFTTPSVTGSPLIVQSFT